MPKSQIDPGGAPLAVHGQLVKIQQTMLMMMMMMMKMTRMCRWWTKMPRTEWLVPCWDHLADHTSMDGCIFSGFGGGGYELAWPQGWWWVWASGRDPMTSWKRTAWEDWKLHHWSTRAPSLHVVCKIQEAMTCQHIALFWSPLIFQRCNNLHTDHEWQSPLFSHTPWMTNQKCTTFQSELSQKP